MHAFAMRVRIDREREERKVATGWFARARIPAYCLSLTVHFTEEERYLIRHTGIGRYVFFQAPIPPDHVRVSCGTAILAVRGSFYIFALEGSEGVAPPLELRKGFAFP